MVKRAKSKKNKKPKPGRKDKVSKEGDIKEQTVRSILQMYFKKPKTKIGPKLFDKLALVIKFMVTECAMRSGKQALSEDTNVVAFEHVEKVLPQLILDM